MVFIRKRHPRIFNAATMSTALMRKKVYCTGKWVA